MPAEKRTEADRKNAKPQERRYYVRLKRGGQHGEEGLGRYFFGKKLYKREGLYRVDKKTRDALKRTGKFEDILPDDLEVAKQERPRWLCPCFAPWSRFTPKARPQPRAYSFRSTRT